MKKVKVLAGAMVVSLAAMGAGYALWSDSIVIDATAKTGKLDVQWVCAEPIKENHDRYDKYMKLGQPVISNEFNQETGKYELNDKVSFTIDKMYPGADALYKVVAKNMGDIPVKFKDLDVKFDTSSDAGLKEQLTVKVDGVVVVKDGREVGRYAFSKEAIGLEGLRDHLKKELDDVVLEPGCEWHFFHKSSEDYFISVYVDDDAKNNTQLKSVNFDLVFDWEQATGKR